MRPLYVNIMRLNRRQTRALVAGIVVIIGMAIYPPWVHVYLNEGGSSMVESAGFGTLTSPPISSSQYNLYTTRVDIGLLLLEWLVAAGITAGVIILSRDRDSETARLMHRYER